MIQNPTVDIYQQLQRAYDHFNAALFDSELPPLLITVERRGRRVSGWFSSCRFQRRRGRRILDQLTLNADAFGSQSDRDIASVLVHEMVHAWQCRYGKPGRRGYHNRQWAKKMKEVGLQPSVTGRVGGAETGESCGHYIITNGDFARTYRDLERGGFRLAWQSAPDPPRQTRQRFTCPLCGQRVWAKPTANLLCGAHDDMPNRRVRMTPR